MRDRKRKGIETDRKALRWIRLIFFFFLSLDSLNVLFNSFGDLIDKTRN